MIVLRGWPTAEALKNAVPNDSIYVIIEGPDRGSMGTREEIAKIQRDRELREHGWRRKSR